MVDGLRRAVDRQAGVAEAETRAEAARALLAELAEAAHRHAALQLSETCGETGCRAGKCANGRLVGG